MMPKSGDQVNTSTQKRGQPSRPMRASRSSRSRPISSLPLPPLRALFRTPRAQYPEDIGDTHFGDSTRCWPHRWTHSNPKFAHILLAALRAAPRGAFLLPSLRLCALQNPTPACQTPRALLVLVARSSSIGSKRRGMLQKAIKSNCSFLLAPLINRIIEATDLIFAAPHLPNQVDHHHHRRRRRLRRRRRRVIRETRNLVGSWFIQQNSSVRHALRASCA